jgi:hypothetical protein
LYCMKLTNCTKRPSVFTLPMTIFPGDNSWTKTKATHRHHRPLVGLQIASNVCLNALAMFDRPTDRIAGSSDGTPAPPRLWGSGFSRDVTQQQPRQIRNGAGKVQGSARMTGPRPPSGKYSVRTGTCTPACSMREPLPRARLGSFEPHPPFSSLSRTSSRLRPLPCHPRTQSHAAARQSDPRVEPSRQRRLVQACPAAGCSLMADDRRDPRFDDGRALHFPFRLPLPSFVALGTVRTLHTIRRPAMVLHVMRPSLAAAASCERDSYSGRLGV